jgi:AcrR family transcriptional regulator
MSRGDAQAAAARILAATTERLAEVGPAKLNLQDVAEAAAVSKGLIHYHFHDKETLLARVVEWVTQQVLQREREALSGADADTALDAVWMWLAHELALGQRRMLLELGAEAGPLLTSSLVASAEARRAQATATVSAVFASFGLVPRVAPAALGELLSSVVDGLVMAAAGDPARDRRVVFDAFWLAVLGLTRDSTS